MVTIVNTDECIPEIEVCEEPEDILPIEDSYVPPEKPIQLILIVLNLLGQIGILMIPLMMGVKQALSASFRQMAIFFGIAQVILIGHAIASTFMRLRDMNVLTTALIVHYLSNIVPILILIATFNSMKEAA